MKYRAFVVPAVGKPLVTGDVTKVLAEVTSLLERSPSYTMSLRSYDKGTRESSHAILIRHDGDDWTVTVRRPDQNYTRQDRIDHDLAEILTVLSNMNIHPNQEHTP
jgi:hypothetical protein